MKYNYSYIQGAIYRFSQTRYSVCLYRDGTWHHTVYKNVFLKATDYTIKYVSCDNLVCTGTPHELMEDEYEKYQKLNREDR